MNRRQRLFRKYVVPIIALVGGTLVASGAIGIYFSYQETRNALVALAREKAASAATRIELFVREIEHQIGWTALPQVAEAGNPLEQRRNDYAKLGRQVQAITEASYISPDGCLQVKWSRLEMDRLGECLDELSQDPRFTVARIGKTHFGPVYFRKETEPYMAIAMRAGRVGGGVTAVEVNLKFIWDVIQGIKIGKTGHAYVVNRDGHLVAHPDISLVLQKTDLSMLPQVKAALARPAEPAEEQQTVAEARDRAGGAVLTAHARIAPLDWYVFVEQPISEAYQPLYAPLIRIGILLLLGLVLSLLASLALARYMVRPINAVREGAEAIGAGNLDHRIEVKTGDELQDLAEQFNSMAEKLRESYAGLERKVEERTVELKETLDQQTATSEILKVISSSPTDVQPVFEAIAQSGLRLFENANTWVVLRDADTIRAAAISERDPERIAKWRAAFPTPLTRDYLNATAILDKDIVEIPDVDQLPRPLKPGTANFAATGYRAVTITPMMRGNEGIGAIGVARLKPGALSPKQIALLKTFADQAVIAIENVRLFNETKEALERQTATAGILRVISSSPTDVQPVFDAIVRNATILCESVYANVFRYDGEMVHFVATHGWPLDALTTLHNAFPARPNASRVAGRVILGKQIVRVEDTLADPDYDQDLAHALGSYRRILGVPMLREGSPVGAITVGWAEPGLIAKHHEELLQTFADQAVIAIENVRLFNETNEALEQQTATADILKVISSTPTDVQPVFDAIVKNCHALFTGSRVALGLAHEDRIEVRASAGEAGASDTYEMTMDRGSGLATCIMEARTIHLPDLVKAAEEFPRLKQMGLASGYRSGLFTPLMREGRPIGAVSVLRPADGAFQEKEIALLKTFADQAVIAIENVRLFHEIEEKSRQLEVANKHKSDFLANMSHELRTPLNAIIGFSEVLLEKMFGEVNEKQLDYLSDIHSSGKHLLSLINDILDLSKIEAGRMELELSTFHLPTALSNAMTLVRERAQRHGIALSLEVDPQLGELQADERKFKQIMLNLLSNAVKFTPEGGSVRVSAQPNGSAVEVAVADTGVGIAPEDQQTVFEEFKQVGRDYTRKAEGTGLGLALTKRFVELHGGQIRLESAPGRGSTFTFTIPSRP